MRLADVIHMNYLLLPVLNRFGIFLGFGNKTVDEICADLDINPGFFLEIVNTFNDPEYFPKEHLQSFSIKLIADYLRETHKYYLTQLLPGIESKINSLVQQYPMQSAKLTLLQKFFIEYKTELVSHIEYEEKKVFPYAVEIEQVTLQNKVSEILTNLSENYSVHSSLEVHDSIEEKLYDLKNILIKYLPGIENQNLCNAILVDLFNLEMDMDNHARIEDKVMEPKVLLLENEIKGSGK